MTAPKKISFRGATYVKVAAHPKCEVGIRWNEKHHKCMPLPDDLKKDSMEAHSFDSLNFNIGHQVRSKSGIMKKHKMVGESKKRHEGLATKAKGLGFHDLAKHAK